MAKEGVQQSIYTSHIWYRTQMETNEIGILPLRLRGLHSPGIIIPRNYRHHLARDIRVDHFSRNETGLYRVPASLWLTRCLCMYLIHGTFSFPRPNWIRKLLIGQDQTCWAEYWSNAARRVGRKRPESDGRLDWSAVRPWTDMRSMEPMTIRPNAQNTVSVGDVIVRRFENYQW